MPLQVKRALVIGNAAYSGAMALDNPTNDATAISTSLMELKFSVRTCINASSEDMQEEISRFVEQMNNERTAVALFYFSGHGVQIEGENYILPIDFDSDTRPLKDKAIPAQRIVDGMRSDVSIMLLDACRSNSAAEAVAGARGIATVDEAKAILVADRVIEPQDRVSISGLKEMTVDLARNVFIAFAAAPGGFAYDGRGSLSPFTGALVRHMGALDIPLSNLMNRVRKEVLAATGNGQRPWDNSSLTEPFFFNPGSLFLFFGTAMALLGLILSFCICGIMLATACYSLWLYAGGAALPALSLVILLYGTQNAYSRVRGRYLPDSDAAPTLRQHALIALEKGGIGGYLGGLFASVFISVPYYFGWMGFHRLNPDRPAVAPIGRLMVEIGVSSASIACLLGALAIFFTRLKPFGGRLRFLSRPAWSEVIASAAIGGMIAGAVAAPPLTGYFGALDRPPVTPDYLLPGSILGSALVIFSIVNFDYERLNIRRVASSALAAGAALGCGAAATLVIFGPLYALGVVNWVVNLLVENFHDTPIMVLGALAYGLPVGAILGTVIGSAVVFTERWSDKPVL